MSIGRISTFLDCYAEQDLRNGVFTEEQIQEFVDHFIMKLRIVRFLRIPAYDELFSGDPTWVTESLGGMSIDGRHMVTKMSYRFLHTLVNLGPAPEPNLTVVAELGAHEEIVRTMAGGIAGLSVLADSLSAIKYAKVTPVLNEAGLAVDFITEGDFPKYGNDDNRVDQIAVDIVKDFEKKLASHYAYRHSRPTMSILTITSNVMYGKKTASTPDGRKASCGRFPRRAGPFRCARSNTCRACNGWCSSRKRRS